MKTELMEILSTNPCMVNLGRVLEKKNKKLSDWIKDNPVGYTDAPFNERVYAIENNIKTRPVDLYGKERRFINYRSGYAGLEKFLKEPEPSLENIKRISEITTSEYIYQKDYTKIYFKVLELTKIHNDISFQERLYLIVNGIKKPEGKFLGFEKGYQQPEIPISDSEYLRLSNKLGSNDVNFGKSLYKYKKDKENLYKELYELPDSENGENFIFEPVLEIRVMMVESKFITNILKMSVEEYDRLYPNVRGRCESSRKNVSKGMKTPNNDGLTPIQIAAEKAKITKSTVGKNGYTPNQLIGINSKKTHMSKIDKNGLNGYQRIAKHRTETLCENGKTIQENADIKRNITMSKNNKSYTRASEVSKKVLNPIIEYFKEKDFSYNFDDKEYAIYSTELNKFYLYDLVCSRLKIAIEYQSYVHHSNPFLSDDEWNSWCEIYSKKTSSEIHEKDIIKAKELYKNRGYITFWVWEHSFEQDVELILEYIKGLKNV